MVQGRVAPSARLHDPRGIVHRLDAEPCAVGSVVGVVPLRGVEQPEVLPGDVVRPGAGDGDDPYVLAGSDVRRVCLGQLEPDVGAQRLDSHVDTLHQLAGAPLPRIIASHSSCTGSWGGVG